jgi:hypothetical protein
MFYTTCTQGIRIDSWLLMVGSQTANLTPGNFFGHNLCFRCPNGSCKPILDIYVSITFNGIKKFSIQLVLTPWNCPLKIQESIGTPTPKMGIHLRVWEWTLTLFYTPGNMRCDSRVSLFARNLANPRLGHEPKVRVTTELHPHFVVMTIKCLEQGGSQT